MRVHVVEHVDFERAAKIATWALKNGHQITRTRFYRSEPVPAQEDFDWLIIMGGPMGAYDDDKYPWLIREKEFIKKAIAADKIVLGICLGAQLIAEVIGGRVYKNSQKEIGWFPVDLTEEGRRSPIFTRLPDRLLPINWHGDTFDLPEGATRLAFSEATSNQAFEFGGRTIGLQFHIEWSRGDIEALIENFGNDPMSGKYIQSPEMILAKDDRISNLGNTMEIILDNISGLSVIS